MRPFAFAALACALAPLPPAHAQTPSTPAQWHQTDGPRGARFTALAAVNGGVLGSQIGPTYRFDGTGWAPLPVQAGDLHTWNGAVYANTGGGWMRSHDDGRTFEPAPALPPDARLISGDATHLVATRDSVVLLSTNAGASWTAWSARGWARFRLGEQDAVVRAPMSKVVGAVKTTNGALLAAGSVYILNDVYRLAPGDTGWVPMLFKGAVVEGTRPTMHAFLSFSGRLYAHTSAGIYTSSDDGATWMRLHAGLAEPLGVATLVAGDEALYLQAGVAAYRLDGTTWTRLPDVPSASWPLAVSASDRLVVSAAEGVFRLDPSGWTLLPVPVATTPFVRYAHGATAFVEVDGTFLRTDDGGDTFTPVGPPRLHGVTFVSASVAFGLTGTAAVRTTDGGATWTPIARPPAPAWLGAIRPGSLVSFGNAVYAAYNSSWCIEHCNGTESWGSVYRTTDAGTTWEAVTTGLPMGAAHPARVQVLFTDGTTLFARTDAGCVRGTGGAWSPAACPPGGAARHAADGATWLALTSSSVYASTNGGASWTERQTGLPAPVDYDSDLLDTDAGVFLVLEADAGARAYRFTGTGWEATGTALPAGVRWASFASGGARLYGGAYGQGLWQAPLATLTGAAPVAEAPGSLTLTAAVPHPVAGHATLALTSDAPARVELLDALGRLCAVLYDGGPTSGPVALSVDAQALPSGLYVVRAWSARGRATRPVLISH